jgi:hypothetical protein
MGEALAMLVVAATVGVAGDRFLVWLNQRRRRRDELHVPRDW